MCSQFVRQYTYFMCLDHSKKNADGPGVTVPIILGKAVAPGTPEKS